MSKIIILTSVAMLCFAANSVLCRMALGQQEIDAYGFTLIRLFSGSITLLLLVRLSARKAAQAPSLTAKPHSETKNVKREWLNAFFLFQYAICFSFAYHLLSAASGALILFGSVQITMIIVSLTQGTRPHPLEWVGMTLAFAGFVYLVLPGLSPVAPSGFFLMALSGIAWGCFTLRGRQSKTPLSDMAWHFTRSLVFVLLAAVFFARSLNMSLAGIGWALASGSIASGLGYAIWYRTLPALTSTSAAVVQLTVPIIAAAAGVILLHEPINAHLLVSSVLVLGGMLLVTLKSYYGNNNR